MGVEAIILIVSAATILCLAVLMGRLVATLLKIAIVIAIAFFVYTHVDTSHLSFCQPGSASSKNAVTQWICPTLRR